MYISFKNWTQMSYFSLSGRPHDTGPLRAGSIFPSARVLRCHGLRITKDACPIIDLLRSSY